MSAAAPSKKNHSEYIGTYGLRTGMLGLSFTWSSVALAAIVEPHYPLISQFLQQRKVVGRVGGPSLVLATFSFVINALTDNTPRKS